MQFTSNAAQYIIIIHVTYFGLQSKNDESTITNFENCGRGCRQLLTM